MTTLSMKTMFAALLAGSLAVTAGGTAFARADGAGADPARFEKGIETRIDKALGSTDATQDQKTKVTAILKAAFADMKPLHTLRTENRKAMEAALQAPTLDPAKIEQIRAAQMKVSDDTSKRFTQALTDAANVLSAPQRQAFFKAWNEHGPGRDHGPRKG